MTANQPPPIDAVAAERRERGLALANALLESGRGLNPLTGAAHARVKRRLVASTLRRSFRRMGWLRPVMIVSLCLLCGAAFGVALDRVVLKRGGGTQILPSESGGSPVRSRARSGRTAPTPPIAAANETTANSGRVSSPPPPLAELSPLTEATRPATKAEVAATPATPSTARASNHARKLALRAAPSNPVPERFPSTWQNVAPVAPASVTIEWPAPAAPVSPSPKQNTPPPILPSTATAASPIVNPPTISGVDSLSEERLLAAALRALRAQTDPQSALAALDEYRTHYPHGRLFVEAEVLRVDALAALKDTPEALRILDRLEFAQMPGGLARQLQRGELRAAAGRHSDAEADFTNVLMRARSQDLDVLERALWGRAQSRANHGDATGARLDADECLRRFPNGRYAAAAARIGSSVAP